MRKPSRRSLGAEPPAGDSPSPTPPVGRDALAFQFAAFEASSQAWQTAKFVGATDEEAHTAGCEAFDLALNVAANEAATEAQAAADARAEVASDAAQLALEGSVAVAPVAGTRSPLRGHHGLA